MAIQVCKFLTCGPYRIRYLPGDLVGPVMDMQGYAQIPANGNALPLEAQNLYRQGLFLVQEGKMEQALRRYRMAVIVAPRFTAAYYAMGNCQDELGLGEDAVRSYEKVLEMDPGHADARSRRDLVCTKMKHQRSGSVSGRLQMPGRDDKTAGSGTGESEKQNFYRCLVFSPGTR